MNNIFLPGNDPLLYNSNFYPQSIQEKMDQKYNEYLLRTKQIPDKLEELDSTLKKLNPEAAKYLENDPEFMDLSNSLKGAIQAEMVLLVKQQINANPETVKNIEQQLAIIKKVEAKTTEEERKNMAELNDYLKNYSNITFDEYKKLKTEANESR